MASTSPTTQFAHDVVNRLIIAGPHVRAACRRHLFDLRTAWERGYRFDEAKEQRALQFFPLVLRLNGGEFEGNPFVLCGWQAFIVGSLFGWVKSETGFRRFDKFYIETGKGSGKSPLVAGIGMYMLTATGEQRAQCFSAASHKDQAKILFADAVAMAKQSPALHSRMDYSGGDGREWNMMFTPTLGFFRPIASGTPKSGTRPYYAVCDELHEHHNDTVLNMLIAGKKSHKEAMIGSITNSGFDKDTICGQQHDYARSVVHGDIEDDSFFSFVCALDEGDDPLKDETCWGKANPSLQEQNLPGMDYLRSEVRQANGMPGRVSSVLRLNFCRWTESETVFVTKDLWEGCGANYTMLEKFTGACYGALDLSTIHDLTAMTLATEPDADGKIWTRTFFWLPKVGLAEKALKCQQPLQKWVDDGYLEVTPGATIDKAYVAKRMVEIAAEYDICEFTYDRYRIGDLQPYLDNAGFTIKLTPHGQGFYCNQVKNEELGEGLEVISLGMASAVDYYEQAIIEGTYRHDNNPVLDWNARNAVIVSDPAGLRKFDKARARNRIDGIVSSAMCVNLVRSRTIQTDEGAPFWF